MSIKRTVSQCLLSLTFTGCLVLPCAAQTKTKSPAVNPNPANPNPANPNPANPNPGNVNNPNNSGGVNVVNPRLPKVPKNNPGISSQIGLSWNAIYGAQAKTDVYSRVAFATQPYYDAMGMMNPFQSQLNSFQNQMNPFQNQMNPFQANMMNPFQNQMNPFQANMMNPWQMNQMNPFQANMMNPWQMNQMNPFQNQMNPWQMNQMNPWQSNQMNPFQMNNQWGMQQQFVGPGLFGANNFGQPGAFVQPVGFVGVFMR